MHKLLERQVRRHFGSVQAVPPGLAPFLAQIEASYGQQDADRALLDHAMNTVSQELVDRNRRLSALLEESAGHKQALEEIQRLLLATIESTADGILVVDSAMRIVLVNRQFADLWKLPADLVGQHDRERIIAAVLRQVKSPDEFLRRLDGVYADPESPSFDVIECTDGRVIQRHSKPQKVDGRTVGRVWSFQDVTAHLMAERAAIASQERSERIARATNDAVYDWDLPSDTMWWNDGLSTLFGYPTDSVRYTLAWWRERVHPEERDRVEETLRRCLEGADTFWEGEYRFRRADGSWAAVLDRCFIDRDAAGGAFRAVGSLMDITERKRQEDGLSRLAAILESTSDYVGTADARGRLLYVNQAARTLLGQPEGDDPGALTLRDLYGGPACDGVIAAGIDAALERGIWSGESVIRARDGRDIPVSSVILAHRGPHGEVEYLSSIARDMSHMRALQAQLMQSQKMEAIGQLAGGVAHDFNNLLTVIKSHCEFLKEDIGLHHPLRADIDAVDAAGERASSLTCQLLAFSRQQLLKPVELDLHTVLTGIEPMLRRLIGEDVEIRTEGCEGSAAARADLRQMEQVLVNLALNARDAMPGGGMLTIGTDSVRLAASGDEELPPGEYARIFVQDTGTGMDEYIRERIFEPFFTTKEQGKGTGLGLSTVYGIVKQSGGHITVASEVGSGTRFTILLPRIESAPRFPAPVAESLWQRGAGHILLVEDEPALRTAAHRILHRCGYQVTVAADGQEARAVIEAGAASIDLLVTDVVMPRGNGRDLADDLRRERPDLPVLFMSGYLEDDVLRRGVSSMEEHLIQKPFSPRELAATVRALLERSSAGASMDPDSWREQGLQEDDGSPLYRAEPAGC